MRNTNRKGPRKAPVKTQKRPSGVERAKVCGGGEQTDAEEPGRRRKSGSHKRRALHVKGRCASEKAEPRAERPRREPGARGLARVSNRA